MRISTFLTSEITAAVQPLSKHVVIVCLKVSVNPGSEEGVSWSIFSLDYFSSALKCHDDMGFNFFHANFSFPPNLSAFHQMKKYQGLDNG